MNTVNTYSESISGPRWADMEGVLIQLGNLHRVRVTIDHVSKGLFRKRVHFTVTGRNSDVDQWCDSAIEAFTG